MIPLLTDPESLTSFGDLCAGETDSVLDLLANRRRRSVLQFLSGRTNAASLADLAEHVAHRERENGEAATSVHRGVPTADLRRIEISLRHTHVPKLAEAGAVSFDADDDVVSLTDEGETLLARAAFAIDTR